MKDWKVGDLLIGVGNLGRYYRRKIVRETKTQWVLDNNERIRKGERRAIGSTLAYYSYAEPYGQTLALRCTRLSRVDAIQHETFDSFTTEQVNEVYELICRIKEENNG
jgi:hypothetical protein